MGQGIGATMTTKPKPAEFDVAVRNSGREKRKGYVLGMWGTHKDKGEYFYAFTHLPTGVSIGAYPVHSTKVSALKHLVRLHTEGPGELKAKLLENTTWGFGY